MPKILGLDPSIKKAGYCILDTDAPYDTFIEKGRLRTWALDGILIQRLLKQQEQIRGIMEKHDIQFVSMEAPYFGGGESEHLFALNQFIHGLFLERGTFVIAFPPQQLKKLACPGQKANKVHKASMILEAKKRYHLQGKILSDDEADALHAGHLGKLFWNWAGNHQEPTWEIPFGKAVVDRDLNRDVLQAFAGKHTLTRGPRKGIVEYQGIIYRENELFFNFKRIAERKSEYGAAEERVWKARGFYAENNSGEETGDPGSKKEG